MSERVLLIAGPTASGKSVLALEKAAGLGGVIVNADSMQVYDGLRVLTARPSPEDEAQATHFLYGSVPPSERFSTGAWLSAVEKLIQQDDLKGRPLIFVGGTGLYFEALENGFISTPDVPEEVVARLSAEVAELDRAGRQALLAARDPRIAAQLAEPDPQRVVRALSVLEATGRSLADWQAQTAEGLLPDTGIERIVLNPDRDVLRSRIADRFGAMFDSGAVEEVQALLALGLPVDLPAMRAIGVPQIAAWLRNEISRDEAVELSVIATRQYAKRQRTWFRKHMAYWEWRG